MPLLCPNCHSNRIQPSRTLLGWLLRIVGRNPYWCQLCSTRFYYPVQRVLSAKVHKV